MKLTQALPEVKSDLVKNDASVIQAAHLQKFLRQEKSLTGVERDSKEKLQLWTEIRDKSTRETEKYLSQVNPEVYLAKEKNQAKRIAPEKIQIQFVADEECMEMLQRLGELNPREANQYGILIKKALKIALEKKDPKHKKVKEESEIEAELVQPLEPCAESPRPIASSHRPYIPVKVRRRLLARSNHQCTYVSEMTGKRCQERGNLQIEHIQPHALGGSSEIQNLTILCRTHNSLRAIEVFGPEKMKKYLKT